MWGGVIGGMFARHRPRCERRHVNGSGVLVGASIGATVGGLVALGIAKDHKLTTGDVALVDTFGGMGTLGGLTIGMLMQPAQSEAYSLNAVLGATAGVIVGNVAAPQTNTTPRRMLRVAGLTLAGGAVPFLLYAGIHDKHGTWDERLTGGLSSLGLIAGAWLGFYLTRDMDEGSTSTNRQAQGCRRRAGGRGRQALEWTLGARRRRRDAAVAAARRSSTASP